MEIKLRWPVDNWGAWYDAQPFGSKTSYGYHEGADINLTSGGNTDYNQPLYPIFKGVVTFIEHLQIGFGSHIIYEIDGPWGTRWVHYAHCIPESIKVKVGDVVYPNQVIAHVGHSGNSRYNGVPVAHTHWAIAKKHSSPNNIANTLTELNDLWEDPIKFCREWLGYTITEGGDSNMDQYKTKGLQLLDEYRNVRVDANGNPAPEGNWESFARSVIGGDKDASRLAKELNSERVENAQLSGKNTDLNEKNTLLRTELTGLYKALSKELGVEVDTQTEAISVLKEVLKQKSETGESQEVLNGLERFILWIRSIILRG